MSWIWSICNMLSTCFQFLETENTRLELEVKDILNDLNHQQDQNELMCNKIEQLELSLSHSKVLPFSFLLIVPFFCTIVTLVVLVFRYIRLIS